MIAIFALILAATNLLLIYGLSKWSSEQDRRLTRLETQKPVKPEPKAAPVQAKQIFEKPVEQPKAGTVAANAIKPKVFLSQVPHKTVQLDNGGLEWECKI
jgi:hypothetical protein